MFSHKIPLFQYCGPMLFLVSLLGLVSCANTKKAVYFNNIQDTLFKAIGTDIEQVIQKNDLLSISVSSLNPEATAIFNSPNTPTVVASSVNGTSNQMTGYLVGQEGLIQFPLLGNIKAAGLTKNELTDTLVNTLIRKKLLIDPIVNIRFLNFRVTVLGEVARPTVITVPNEKISILEALGFAGDLTIFAKRDNVLLIREEGGNKITKRIDLTASDILSSPFYYLKTNDVIYAEPVQARLAATSTVRQNIPIVLSALSFIAIIFTYALRR